MVNIASTEVMTANENAKIAKLIIQPNVDTSWVRGFNPIQDFLIGQTLPFQFPDLSVPVLFRADNVVSENTNSFYWIGYNDDGSRLELLKSERGTFGSAWIASNGRAYSINSLSPTKSLIVKYRNEFDEGGCEDDFINSPIDTDTLEVEERDDCHSRVVRVLFLYTMAALATGVDLTSTCNTVINQINTATWESGITNFELRFKAATTEPICLSGFNEENTSPQTTRKVIKNVDAQNLRDIHQADIVVLLCGNVFNGFNNSSGQAEKGADEDEAYVTSTVDKAVGYMKVSHGIGHLFRAGHDLCIDCANGMPRCQIINIPFTPRNCGHKLEELPLRTIMSDCSISSSTRIARWSNPSVDYNGHSTSNFWNVNNAKVMKKKAAKVACFREDTPSGSNNDIEIIGPSELCEGINGSYSLFQYIGLGPSVVWEISNDGI